MKRMQDIVLKAQSLPKALLVVAVAHDEPVLEAVVRASEAGFIDPYLIGDKKQIEKIFKLNDWSCAATIVDETDAVRACQLAVEKVHDTQGALLMKGLVDTSVLLKAALAKEKGLRTNRRISHVSVFDIPSYDRVLLMSDGAMNIAPTIDEKQDIIENAVHIAHALGIETPNVGIIAAVEKVNPKMPATLDAVELIKRQQEGRIQGCVVEGPYAIDNAVSVEAAKHKGIDAPGAGKSDILIMPVIEAGNVFYKTLMFLAQAKSASVIAGALKPIVLTSRADSSESKYYSIALAACVAAQP